MSRTSLLAGAFVCLLVTTGCLGVLGREPTLQGATPGASIPATGYSRLGNESMVRIWDVA